MHATEQPNAEDTNPLRPRVNILLHRVIPFSEGQPEGLVARPLRSPVRHGLTSLGQILLRIGFLDRIFGSAGDWISWVQDQLGAVSGSI